MRLVFAGTPAVAVPALEALVASDHDVVGVVTRPDARRGRGGKVTASAVGARAAELGIRVWKPTHPRDPDFQRELAQVAPDACPVVAYGALLPQSALDLAPHGWINLHFSLLPAYRGAAPVQAAIFHGETETGATTFRIVKEMDAGPIIDHLRTPIGPHDSAGDLLERLAQDGAHLLVRSMDAIAEGTAQFVEQDHAAATYAAKIEPDDALIRWEETAAQTDRRVRACSPAPGAWTTLEGEKFRIHRARPTEVAATTPGLVETTRQVVRVHTGDHQLELLQVQPAGKRAMNAADWANGLHGAQVRLGA